MMAKLEIKCFRFLNHQSVLRGDGLKQSQKQNEIKVRVRDQRIIIRKPKETKEAVKNDRENVEKVIELDKQNVNENWENIKSSLLTSAYKN